MSPACDPDLHIFNTDCEFRIYNLEFRILYTVKLCCYIYLSNTIILFIFFLIYIYYYTINSTILTILYCVISVEVYLILHCNITVLCKIIKAITKSIIV